MTPSSRCVELIVSSEGCELTSYLDKNDGWTIGYGHMGPEVRKGQKITQEKAEALLRLDVKRFGRHVSKAVEYPLNQNQFDACVDFTYNLGPTQFRSSTLLKKINRGDLLGACAQFSRWLYDDGKILGGLAKRRSKEALLFSERVY